MQSHIIGLPVPYRQRPREETAAWPEEKKWANRCLDSMGEQLKAKPAPSVLPDFGTPSLPPRQSAAPGATDKPAIAAPK